MNQLPEQINSLAVWLQQVEVALAEIAEYLAHPDRAVDGTGTQEQLLYLQEYLENIKQSVLLGPLPTPRDRKVLSLGWVVADGWNPRDPLGIRIALIDDYYLHKI